MNQQIRWLDTQIETLATSTRQCEWELRELEAFRAELGGVWADRCAQDMASRYLNPMANDASEGIRSLHEQAGKLSACSACMGAAYQQFVEASARSSEVESLLNEAGMLLRTVDSLISETESYVKRTMQGISESETLLRQAEARGNSAPRGG